MPLSDIMEEHISSVFFNTDDFAVSATYTAPNSDSGTTVTVMLNVPESSREQEATAIDRRRLTAEVLVPVSEIAEPVEGGVFVINSQSWRIGASNIAKPVEYQDESQLIWRCYVTRKA